MLTKEDVLEGCLECQNLYSVTGNVKDVNTMLVNRGELVTLMHREERERKEKVSSAWGHGFAFGAVLGSVCITLAFIRPLTSCITW